MTGADPITITLTRDSAVAALIALRTLSQFHPRLGPIDWTQERMKQARIEAETTLNRALKPTEGGAE